MRQVVVEVPETSMTAKHLFSTYYVPNIVPNMLSTSSHLVFTSSPPRGDRPLLVYVVLGLRIYKASKRPQNCVLSHDTVLPGCGADGEELTCQAKELGLVCNC